MPRKTLPEPIKKEVASRQKWKCSNCRKLLEATYQVDHTLALMNGGSDHIDNLTAMCVPCHATKTHQEHLDRIDKIKPPAGEYYDENREDIVISPKYIKCNVCYGIRSIHSKWEAHKCPGPGLSYAQRKDLAKFSYSKH
jgi:hypothetical protein